MNKSFNNHYCPICLCPVDASGNHWETCEYEARLNDWINPKQPLTELEMMKAKLGEEHRNRLQLLKALKNSKQRIESIKSEIKEKENANAPK